MKLNHSIEPSNTEIRGNKDSHVMKIKESSKLFSIMVDGLYQDKLGAVIRETASNCYDAHVLANKKDVPFIVGLPDEINNTLYFQDFGNGLSNEEMILYFGTLLETSKDNDDEAIGGYGIGAKSPFALVDEFIVSSVKDGIETTILFSRENKGTPTFYTISSNKTDKESGTRVSLELDMNEYTTNYVLNAVLFRLCCFKTLPKIYSGNIEIKAEWPKFKKLTDKLSYIRCNNFTDQYDICESYLNIGGVLYPIDDKFCDEYHPLNALYSFIYTADISEIKPAPDRERIELTKQNKEIIYNIKKTQYEEFIKVTTDKFLNIDQSKYENIYNFCMHYSNLTIYKFSKNNVKIIDDENILKMFNVDSSNNDFYSLLNTYLDKNIFTRCSLYEKSRNKNKFLFYSKIDTVSKIFRNSKIVITSNATNQVVYDKIVERNNVCIVRVKKAYVDIVYNAFLKLAEFYNYNKNDIVFINETDIQREKRKNTINVDGLYIYKNDEYFSKRPIAIDEVESLKEKNFTMFNTNGRWNIYPNYPQAIMNLIQKDYIIVLYDRKTKGLEDLSTYKAPHDIYSGLFKDKLNVIEYFDNKSVYASLSSSYNTKSMFKKACDENIDDIIKHNIGKISSEQDDITLLKLYDLLNFKTRVEHSTVMGNILITKDKINDTIKHIVLDRINQI